MTTFKYALALSLCAGTLFANVSVAQTNWPSKPVTMVVPFPPGGPTDIVARAIANDLAKRLNQTFVVENRAGANGTIGSAAVARANPDGYTILYNTSSLALSPALYKDLTFNPKTDFEAISTTANIPLVLLTHPKSNIKNFDDLVSALKDEKKNLSYGSAGQGNITHLGAFLFTQEVQTNPQHIPYRGSAPAMVDLVGGQTDFMMNTLNDSVPFIKDGKVIALALASKARNMDVIPDTPTLSEKLGKELVVGAWQGIVAPKGTPKEIIDSLNKAVNETLQSDSFKELAKTQGVEILGSSSEDYQAFINSETDRWDETVKKSGIQKN